MNGVFDFLAALYAGLVTLAALTFLANPGWGGIVVLGLLALPLVVAFGLDRVAGRKAVRA